MNLLDRYVCQMLYELFRLFSAGTEAGGCDRTFCDVDPNHVFSLFFLCTLTLNIYV